MSDLDAILESLPIDQIAGVLGVSSDEIRDAAGKAIPALVGGMQANAADGGEQSLADALQQHAGNDPKSLDDIDVEDGSKIVNNVFGDNSDQVVQKLGSTTAGGSDLLKKLLPMLAPMVMAFLASRVLSGHKSGGTSAAPSTTSTAPTGDGSGPVEIPGNLGGTGDAATTTTDASTSTSGGGLGDILGSVLGGGSATSGSSSSGGGLGDILGGLLGGGKK